MDTSHADRRAMRQIGKSALEAFPIGLGCASLSGAYGPADEGVARNVLAAALDMGVTLFDTSDKYGWGHNEELLGRAFTGRHEAIQIATKFGNLAGRDGKIADGRPEFVMTSCDASLKRLKRESIDLYYQHRVDPSVPIEDTVGAMARLAKQGKVKALGLCEANPVTLRRACAVYPISAIQIEYSLLYRTEAEELLVACRELGVSLVAYSPLGRGLLTGAMEVSSLTEKDERLRHPRFAPANLARNLELADQIERIAKGHGVASAQIALAWVLAQGKDVIPIPGTKSVGRLAENVGAADIALSAEELAFLSAAFPPGVAAGLRYRAEHMKNMFL